MWEAKIQPNATPARSRPKSVGRELGRRRHGRDPIEAIKYREDRQRVQRKARAWQVEQRQPAQAVIDEQQRAVVVTVGKPTRATVPKKSQIPISASIEAAVTEGTP